jgi:hypothetical protein
MASKMKSPAKRPKKKIPAPGRKMSESEARNHVFKKFGGAMAMLAKH